VVGEGGGGQGGWYGLSTGFGVCRVFARTRL
jgi:hypothetical protein